MADRLRRRLRRALRGRRPAQAGPAPTGGGDAAAEPRRDVPVEPTHLGPALDQRVAIAKGAVRRPAGPDYTLVAENFDFAHYLLQGPPLIERHRIDLVQHFLRDGVELDRSPDVNFSTSRYLERYPQRADGPERSPYAAWLRVGRDAGEIADPAPGVEKMADVLGVTPQHLAGTLGDVRTDVRERFLHGRLGEVFNKAAEIEPLIGSLAGRVLRPTIPPLMSEVAVEQVAAIRAAQVAAGSRPARLVLLLPHPRWGGGPRMEGHIARAVSRHVASEEIVVVYTDGDGTTTPGRFPDGVREVRFADAVAGLEEPYAERALVELVRSFHADAVVNINSMLGYRALAHYGRAMADSERVFLLFFCNEQLPRGNWVGLPLRHFYRNVDVVEGVITDSAYLAGWLREQFGLGEEVFPRLHVFRAPVDPSLPLSGRPSPQPGRRPRVYWSGRLDRQKRVGLVAEIARRLPDVDFLLWGQADLDGAGTRGALPANIELQGSYDHISDLDLAEADLWLYTSGWDGVPSVLLEVGLTGVPIVGTLVGGTGEVLTEEHSWPVPEDGDAAPYVSAIREILADPDTAARRAAGLRERLLRERTEEGFAEHVASVLLRADREDAG